MDVQTAVRICLTEKYATFSGRAARSEFWWFALFAVVGNVVLGVLSAFLAAVFALGILLPGIAVAVRRLHDLDRSGWWYLLVLVPVLGSLLLIFGYYIHPGTEGCNRFGSDPLDGRA